MRQCLFGFAAVVLLTSAALAGGERGCGAIAELKTHPIKKLHEFLGGCDE